MQFPRTIAGGMRTAAGVVVDETGTSVGGEADVVMGLRIAALQNVDESLVFRHPKAKATAMPDRRNAKRAQTMETRHSDGRFIAIRVALIACRICTAQHAERTSHSKASEDGLPSRSSFRRRTGPPSRRSATLRRGILRLRS